MVQDILEVLFESELGAESNSRNFTEDILLESCHTVFGCVLFFWRVWTWRI